MVVGTREDVSSQSQGADTGSSPASTIASSTALDTSYQRLLFPSLVEPIGERRAKELGLSEVNKENAIRLWNDLWPLQRAYRIRESKLLLCRMVSDPDSRAESDVFAQSNESSPYKLLQFRSKADIIEADLTKRCGTTTINENADELLFTSMEILRRWLCFQGLEDYGERSTTVKGKHGPRFSKGSKKGKGSKEAGSRTRSEGSIERSIGGLLQGIFLSEDLLVTE
jgi:hypothetical protein